MITNILKPTNSGVKRLLKKLREHNPSTLSRYGYINQQNKESVIKEWKKFLNPYYIDMGDKDGTITSHEALKWYNLHCTGEDRHYNFAMVLDYQDMVFIVASFYYDGWGNIQLDSLEGSGNLYGFRGKESKDRYEIIPLVFIKCESLKDDIALELELKWGKDL